MEEPSSEGNINVPPAATLAPAPTAMPEYIAPIQGSLLEIFKSGYIEHFGRGSDDNIIAFINKTLKDNNAIIAGGFLLNAINNSYFFSN